MIRRIARFLAIAALWIVLAAYILASVVLSAVWSALPVLLAILLTRRKHAVIWRGSVWLSLFSFWKVRKSERGLHFRRNGV